MNNPLISEYIEAIKHSEDNLKDAIEDEYGVKYSRDGKKLLKASSSFREKEYVVREGTEVICDGTFSSCKSLQSITISISVTNIGNWAFGNCESLQSVTISNSVTKIGDYAFANCWHLDEPSRLRLKELNYPQYRY